MSKSDIQSMIEDWLASCKRLLILAHERPDGDALGSQLGLHLILSAAGHECVSYLSQPFPARYEPIFAPASKNQNIYFEKIPETFDFDGILVLDTSNAKRTDTPEGLDIQDPPTTVCTIDHHYDNERFGTVNWVDSTYAATAQMIAEFAKNANLPIPAPAATALLAGIMTDCGGFRFRNTTASVFRAAAELTSAGADPGKLADALFFNEPYAKMRLRTRILESAKFERDGRFAYAVLTPQLFDELGLKPSDTEDVIDVIRAIRGVEIACLLQQTSEGDVRVSLRSRSDRFDVSELAHELGGGGHRLASGAKLKNTPVTKAIHQIITLTDDLLHL